MIQTFKVVFVGEAGVGKTSLINAYLGKDITRSESTIGVDFYNFEYDNKFNIVIWDFAGQIWFRDIVTNFLMGAHLVVMVFDLSRPDTLISLLENWAEYIEKIAGKDVHVIVVGNKSDIKTIPDEIITQTLNELKNRLNIVFYVQTSALIRENIPSLFNSIFELIKLEIYMKNRGEKIANKISSV